MTDGPIMGTNCHHVCKNQCNLLDIHHRASYELCVPGASTVKWIAIDPCSGSSASDPNLYTNFAFHEIEIHKHIENL